MWTKVPQHELWRTGIGRTEHGLGFGLGLGIGIFLLLIQV